MQEAGAHGIFITEDPAYLEPEQPLQGSIGRASIEKTDNYGQAGRIWRRYSQEVRKAS